MLSTSLLRQESNLGGILLRGCSHSRQHVMSSLVKATACFNQLPNQEQDGRDSPRIQTQTRRRFRIAISQRFIYDNPSAKQHNYQQRRLIEILIDPKKISQQKEKEKKRKKSWNPANRFTDRIRIRVSGGRGGKGSLSSHNVQRSAYKLRPDGGHGGNGGSVLLIADHKVQTLRQSSAHFQAQAGTNGGSQGRHGRNGKNCILRVPPGVVVKRILDFNEIWDGETNTVKTVHMQDGVEYFWEESFDDEIEYIDESSDDIGDDEAFDEDISEEEIDIESSEIENNHLVDGQIGNAAMTRESIVLADLDHEGAYVLVARGGRGGMGTINYASQQGSLPDASFLIQRAQPVAGEVAHLELELKLLADIGLVGFPNAGKSSLLRAMSQAQPEVAPYPFTTLHPIIGCIDYRDGYRVKVADIPGLIEGASHGKGHGFEFLRHIERTKALMYIVDAAGVDYRDPAKDLYILAGELESYGDGSLLDRRAIVVANKLDLLDKERIPEIIGIITEASREIGIHFDGEAIGISAGVTGEGLGNLAREIREVVSISDAEREMRFVKEQENADTN